MPSTSWKVDVQGDKMRYLAEAKPKLNVECVLSVFKYPVQNFKTGLHVSLLLLEFKHTGILCYIFEHIYNIDKYIYTHIHFK